MRVLSFLLVLVAAPIWGQAQNQPKLLWRYDQTTGIIGHAFSHSGSVLALVSNHATVLFWDLHAGKFTRTIRIPDHDFFQATFLPGDSEIVLVSAQRSRYFREEAAGAHGEYQFLFVLNLRTEDAHWVATVGGQCAISNDGLRIAILDSGGHLSLHDTRSFALIDSLQFVRDSAQYRYTPPYNVWCGVEGFVTYWRGQYELRDSHTLRLMSKMSKYWKRYWPSRLLGEAVFIRESNPSVFYTSNWDTATLQPTLVKERFCDHPNKSPDDVILFGRGRYLASRYAVETWSMPIDYGTRTGIDSLLISTPQNPEGEWGIQLAPTMQVLDVLPSNDGLLLGDGTSFTIVDAKSHSIKPLTTETRSILGFTDNGSLIVRGGSSIGAIDARNGDALWKQESVPDGEIVLAPSGRVMAQLLSSDKVRYYDAKGRIRDVICSIGDYARIREFFDDGIVLQSPNDIPKLYSVPDLTLRKPEQHLGSFLRAVPITKDTVLAFGEYWSKKDTVEIYDYGTGQTIRSFAAGLNNGCNYAAISNDRKWLATIAGGGSIWRVSDGQLVKSFSLDHWSGPTELYFTPNDRYLIYCNDSGVCTYDLISDKRETIIRSPSHPFIAMNRDGSLLAVQNWQRGLEMYETPRSWRVRDSVFEPKTVILPLRFYLPKEAREALENGKPFSPARTDVVLELRRADGSVIKRLVNGPLHKGKWHLWNYDMSGEPKGRYIMHTEIGGAVRDEKLELK